MNTTVRLVLYYFFLFACLVCFFFFSFGLEDQRFKVLLLRCVCRKVTGQRKESVYSSLARCTLVIVTESTNSCDSLDSSRRDSELSPRSRCLQERTDKMATSASVSAYGRSSGALEQLRVLSHRKEANLQFYFWGFFSPVVQLATDF